MAAPTTAAILAGIEARLATISGLRHTAYVPDQVTVPQAIIHTPEHIRYNSTFKKGMMEYDVVVVLLVSKAVDRVAETSLDLYRDADGSKSISLAIAGDATLGSVVDDCYVEDSTPLNQVMADGVAYYGGRFNLKILARGS